jgi:glycosyltransferase involved in cell wall biosynthesis
MDKNLINKTLKIAVITQASFPIGLASSNRVFYHAKGLIANGSQAKVFISWPTERLGTNRNFHAFGEFNGIPYEYANKRNFRSKYFLGRRIHDIFGPVMMALQIVREGYDAAVMISWNSFYLVNLLKLVFMFSKVKLIAERTELPFHSKKTEGIHKIKNKIILLYAYKWLYGFLVISYALKDHFKSLVSKNCPIVLIPVIIDEKDIFNPEIPKTRNLVYTGPLLQHKDGILTIIEAFSMIADLFPETQLIMTGDIERSSDKDKIYRLLKKSGYENRMKLTGFISREEMINYLNSAAGLLMAKPLSEQADTCFPTRLGEYLSTGNPIVVTETGEIPIYLKDGINAFISKPGSVELYADKLKELLSDDKRAEEIGSRGRKTAKDKFNYEKISQKIIHLINDKKKFQEDNED